MSYEVVRKQDYVQELVKDRLVILSKRGKTLDRNIIYILKELQKEAYKNLKINVVCTDENKEKFEKLLARHKVKRYRLVPLDSVLYHKVMNSAEYIMTNTTMESAFTKKQGQKLILIWYKTMGKKVEKPAEDKPNSAYANTQRNLIMTDYYVVRNDYTIPQLLKSYEVNVQTDGKMICSGFPRNCIFLENNEEKRSKIKTELGVNDKKVYLYVPNSDEAIRTKDTEQFADQLLFYMEQMDAQLNEDEVCLIKYPLAEGWNQRWESLQHVISCPKKYDLYNYLDLSDVLITDYSDCCYDFMISRKKTVFFAYDYPLLRKKAEFDIPLDRIGIPLVYSIGQLVQELRSPIDYDGEALVQTFGTYDCIDAADKLSQSIFLKEESTMKVNDIISQ